MQLTRKEFFKTATVITGGVLLGNSSFARILAKQADGFREIREGVGVYTQKGGTMGWYISKDGGALVDSQFPDSAETFLKGYRERTNAKINVLFNTHHHRDHTSGNFFLKNHVEKIIAHENCPRLQLKQNKGTENAKSQVYADRTFTNTWGEDVGDEHITAQYLGPAHTGGDSVILFEEANVAHLGDLVFNEIYPRIDTEGGGNIEGWIEVLERAAKRYSSDTVFIFGHAVSPEMVVGKKSDITRMRDYLAALMDFVHKQTADGKSLDEMKKAEFIPLFKNRKATWEGALAANIEAAYLEQNKDKKEK